MDRATLSQKLTDARAELKAASQAVMSKPHHGPDYARRVQALQAAMTSELTLKRQLQAMGEDTYTAPVAQNLTALYRHDDGCED